MNVVGRKVKMSFTTFSLDPTKNFSGQGYVVNSIEENSEDLAELSEPLVWKRKERGSDSEAEDEIREGKVSSPELYRNSYCLPIDTR